MDSTAFFWTLLATFFAGLHIFAGKVVAHKRLNSALNSVISYLMAIPVFGCVLYFSGQGLPMYWMEVMLLGICAGLAYGLSAYARIEALKYIDSVIFFPLSKIIGPFLAVCGGVFFFSETLTTMNVIGVALSLCVPLLLLQKGEHVRQGNLKQGLILMLLATVTATMTVLVAKGALTISNGIFFYMLVVNIAGLVASATLLKNGERKEGKLYVHTRDDYFFGVVSGILGIASYVSLMTALSYGKVSLVYTIQAHYIVIPIVLSVWFYKEHMDARKFAAVLLSLVAIGLLV
jgi:uncharacterized membrane protein